MFTDLNNWSSVPLKWLRSRHYKALIIDQSFDMQLTLKRIAYSILFGLVVIISIEIYLTSLVDSITDAIYQGSRRTDQFHKIALLDAQILVGKYQNDDTNAGESIKHQSVRANKSNSSGKPKLILAYTTIYGKEFDLNRWRLRMDIRKMPNPLAKCRYKCSWSMDLSDYNKSDAVVFHMYNLSPEAVGSGHGEFVISKLPTRYSKDQKWVLMIREPGSFFYPQQLKLLDDKFNLTMTFQSDSDVVIPYGRFWKTTQTQRTRNYSARKDKMVAWLASNCVTSSRREEYVKQLSNHITVDIYGKCGPLKASSEGDGTLFRQRLAVRYKFYIAFENSDCDDYITEKFWDTLSLGMIPIVRGKRINYQKFAPPMSYIHADSFETPRDLANYLKNVSTNATLFNKYHQWRRTYRSEFKRISANPDWICDLCEQVHVSPPKTVNVYKHFSEDTRCDVFNRTRDRSNEHMEDLRQ